MTDEQLYEIMMDAMSKHPEYQSAPGYLIEELLAAALTAGIECGGLVVTAHDTSQNNVPNSEIDKIDQSNQALS
jgi:hypothetical protein